MKTVPWNKKLSVTRWARIALTVTEIGWGAEKVDSSVFSSQRLAELKLNNIQTRCQITQPSHRCRTQCAHQRRRGRDGPGWRGQEGQGWRGKETAHHTKPLSGFGAAPVDGVRSVSSRPRPRWQTIYFCTLMKYIFSSVDSLVLRILDPLIAHLWWLLAQL